MSRVTSYLPCELVKQAKEAGLNISALAQEAIRSSPSARDLKAWTATRGRTHRLLSPTSCPYASEEWDL